MDHGEAIQMMAAERYLLDELTPEEKDAFEQHLFDCRECALDLRAGALFVTEAKVQLAEMESQSAASSATQTVADRKKSKKKVWWFFWQPAFAVPAFAAMLAVIVFQNVSTIPSLRRATVEPRILHSNAIHAGTRGAAHTAVLADRIGGLALAIELPSSAAYSSYAFVLRDSTGKQVWNQNLTTSNVAVDDSAVSLVIPGAGLMQSSYSLDIFGTSPQTGRVEIDHRILDVQFDNLTDSKR